MNIYKGGGSVEEAEAAGYVYAFKGTTVSGFHKTTTQGKEFSWLRDR